MQAKHFAACCALGIAFSTGSAVAFAQSESFPSRLVTIIAPFPPGSTGDIIPRALAPLMAKSLGVTVIVDNRPGAGTSIGAAFVAKAKPDGHTVLLATTPTLAVNQWLYKDLAYSPEKDLLPIINAATTPNVIVVHPSVPVKSLRELIAFAKARPNALSFASGGNGTTHHLCGEMLKAAAGIQIVHVPYKGPALALQDVVAGHVPLMCENYSNAVPHLRAGRLRALAITAKARRSDAPDIPTANESGLPGFEVGVWYSFAAPAGTPKPVIDKLNLEIGKALRNPVVAERLDSLGLTFIANSPEEFTRFVAVESARWRKVVEASGAKID